jgi:hypothetical protein
VRIGGVVRSYMCKQPDIAGPKNTLHMARLSCQRSDVRANKKTGIYGTRELKILE